MLKVAAAERTIFEELRQHEFARLDEQGIAYLDATGSALYGASQIRAHAGLLARGVFGNPHSEHRPSREATALIGRARERVLRFFDVDRSTHEVVFTANTSAAIKLVAESYPFDEHAVFLQTADNHNSVNGVREYARRAGARVGLISLDGELRLREAVRSIELESRGLFAMPAQSNFSGVRHDLELVSLAHRCGLDVLIDVAALAPTSPLSLRDCPADFTALSFYKLFGYPTGVGALIARREALARLRRPWFAGGTVRWVSVAGGAHRLRPGHEGFEDGTPDFLGIAALEAGFDLLERAGMAAIAEHVKELTCRFLEPLLSLRHARGAPLVKLHGPSGLRARGGTVAFNVLDAEGGIVPHWIVEQRARESGVAIRGGCFCNPGASEAAFGLDPSHGVLVRSLGEDFTPQSFSASLGRPVGAVRASFGLATNASDVTRGLDVIASFRD